MSELINLKTYPVKFCLKELLQDKTTKKNIIWATTTYEKIGEAYQDNYQITINSIYKMPENIFKPRILKNIEQQTERKKRRAEVFTPSCICNKMINYCDDEWFGEKQRFNCECDKGWQTLKEKIEFSKKKNWKKYVKSRRLEITCGEAPYIVSRYDMSTGMIIPITNRIGLLDRKLRAVNENVDNEIEWMKWTIRAFQNVFGYEYQGDNLLIARINLLNTFVDNLAMKWNRQASIKELKKIANIISWNVWQMDGLSGTVPIGAIKGGYEMKDLFSQETIIDGKRQACIIKNWRYKSFVVYNELKENIKKMKFDFIIGNPPFQDETLGENDSYAPPIYNKFIDEAYKIGEKVELIHPARFLFNAGSTPKAWNKKMLEDTHFKVMYYEPNGEKIFTNTDIKGGIAISYHDESKTYGAIDIFSPYEELNTILGKVKNNKNFISLSTIIVTSYAYHFLPKLYIDFPNIKNSLSVGHEYDLKSNVFEKMPTIFFDEKPNDRYSYIRILGRTNRRRMYKYVRKEYINNVSNLCSYKVFLPGAMGNGEYGEKITTPVIGIPQDGATETFLSIGNFMSKNEAENLIKFIKTRFARSLLGILKRTQANTPGKWKWVPLQDFTSSSKIDWSKSIAEIDKQLFEIYGLGKKEISFIDSHVREMV